MEGSSKAAIAIGGLSGGLLGYLFARNRPWTTLKKVVAVLVGVAGGGAAGYGISKVPSGGHGYRTAGLKSYPKYESASSTIQEAAVSMEAPQKKLRASSSKCGKNTCQRPEDSMRSDMLQWVELVKSPKAVAQGHLSFSNSADIYRYARDNMRTPQENMYVMMLNNRNNPIGHVLVSRGSKSEATVSPDDVFRPALLAGASRVVVTHNHPSGDVSPSPQDIALTRRLVAAGKELNVHLLDHLIISERGYTSLRDVGIVQ